MGEYRIEAARVIASLPAGWQEFSGGVTMTGPSMTLTCDRLKTWLAPKGQGLARAEASGHVVAQGRYVDAEKNEWRVRATADSARYNREAGKGVLEGSVDAEAINTATGDRVSVKAQTVTYDAKTHLLDLAGNAQPVDVKYQPAAPQAKAGQTEGKAAQ